MKKKISGIILIVFILLIGTGCTKKVDSVLQLVRQEKRKDNDTPEWWLLEEMNINAISPLIEFYKKYPDESRCLTWDLIVSSQMKQFSDIQWIYFDHFITIRSYIT